MLYQVTVATDDIQRVDNRLPRLICQEDDKEDSDKNTALVDTKIMIKSKF